MTFEEAMDYALTLPGTERSASYGRPCVKANGSGFLFVGHEPQEAFALHMEMTTKQIVLETHPKTFFQDGTLCRLSDRVGSLRRIG
jgi:hypothetical protein